PLAAVAIDLGGEQQINPVPREDEARDARRRIDRNGDGAHARLQNGGEKALVAGTGDLALGDRLARGDAPTDDGADERGLFDLALQVVGRRRAILRPRTPLEILR